MLDYLVNYAIEKIWCSPHQDYHTIIQPRRITPYNGTRMKVRVLWHELPLPDKARFYHVYQIGALPPAKIGIKQLERDRWVKMSQVMLDNDMLIDMYNVDGVQFPRFDTYIRRMLDGNLIIAAPRGLKGFDLNQYSLFIRFYRNAYFSSDRFTSNNPIRTNGRIIRNAGDISALQIEYNNLGTQQGASYVFINGHYSNQLNQNVVQQGDWVEWVHDKSIKRVVTLPFSSLREFGSRLDNQRKFLVHYTTSDVNTIEYLDDVDFFVLAGTATPLRQGVYYHQNTDQSVRMVTHRDYSLPTDAVSRFVSNNSAVFAGKDRFIRLHIRHSGFDRPLVFEHNRIHELYKLPDATVVNAMVGHDSLIPEWRAENLEASSYVRIMRHKGYDLPASMVQDALGYDAIVKLMADSPVLVNVEDGVFAVKLPKALHGTGMVFEYNQDRVMTVQHYKSYFGTEYILQREDTKLIEIIPGHFPNMENNDDGDVEHSEDEVNVWLNVTSGTLPPGSYSFYKVPKALGSDDPVEGASFDDVTDQEALLVSREHFITIDNFTTILDGIKQEILHYVNFFVEDEDEPLPPIAPIVPPSPSTPFEDFVTREQAKEMVINLRDEINTALVVMDSENTPLEIEQILAEIAPLAFGFDLVHDDGRDWLFQDTMEEVNGLLTVLEMKRFLVDVERFLGKASTWETDDHLGLTYAQMPGNVINTGFTFDGSSFEWEEDPNEWVLMVRRNDSGVSASGNFSAANGYLEVMVSEKAMTPNGIIDIPSPVEGGKVLVWLNGHPLIRNVDYMVDWPRIIVWNKKYLTENPDDPQDLRVFVFGNASDATMSQEFLDAGFVVHGYLSNNDRFDLRDDKVVRTVIGGRLYHQSELNYFEDNRQDVVNDIQNGEPYSIDRLPIHLDGFVPGTRVAQFKERSIGLDRRVSAYLKTRVEQPTFTDPNGSPDWYSVASPFFGRVIQAIKTGEIVINPMDRVDNTYLEQKVGSFVWLLDFDPIHRGYNKDFVFVHPHNRRHAVEVLPHQLHFLNRVNERYMKGEVKLHQFMRIGE